MLKVELAWLACIVEKLVAVKNFEVFWDQSRASYPRIIAQKCSNWHGNFLTLEEFDGRRKCGSIMVLEGRFGQGWDRLMVEVCKANCSLQVMREVQGCEKVVDSRSYARW